MFKSDIDIKLFVGSSNTGIIMGTFTWKWMDDDGKERTFLIPKSFYVNGGNIRLLSPQHWYQTPKYTKPNQGNGSKTDARKVSLFSNQKKNKMIIPLEEGSNIYIIPWVQKVLIILL